ncbi:ImmA/IrrE family metallo-endopeptidase [Robertmurraya sp. DFI.2.37]|uniref:ImmA/IrrE family metallo-endopeptidase n=1 Tax=Robertmurraya sp. DFI.2.37 TaxID=3031819 RepID=UPI00124762E0|nr:ImmA/IrrE family metallo-endopeptidase [Robertmurraya sp. DFI.2.37]MDF1510534.1 ImmA/IrrE family metallo-endopeptidase [Robertmurraya sp. DFI.2.37]
MLSESISNSVREKAFFLFESIKPWSCTDQFLLTYNARTTYKLFLDFNEIELHKKPFSIDSFCGMLCIDELGTTIVINDCHIPSRQLFTIFHEFGHYCLHRDKQSLFIEDGLDDGYSSTELEMEQEANLFASELLVPTEVLALMMTHKFSFKKIASTIGISFEALKWRLYRYLREMYELNYHFALGLVEQYKDKSFKGKVEESLIFHVKKDKFLLYEIYEALHGRESYIENYIGDSKVGVIF